MKAPRLLTPMWINLDINTVSVINELLALSPEKVEAIHVTVDANDGKIVITAFGRDGKSNSLRFSNEFLLREYIRGFLKTK